MRCSPSSSWFLFLPEENPGTSRGIKPSLLPPPLQLWNTSTSLSCRTVFVTLLLLLLCHLLLQHQGHQDQGDVLQGGTGSRTETETFPILNPVPPLARKLIFSGRVALVFCVILRSLPFLSLPPEMFSFRFPLVTCSLMSRNTIQDY